MIRTERLGYAVGDFRLAEFTLEVAPGEYFVLLGPPGSGKTLFLECLSGLNRIDTGRIYLDGRDVTHLEPRERRVGYVPQDYALFPHVSVEGNICFGLRGRRLGGETKRERTRRVAELLNVTHLLKRRPAGLSGGERQRVALARAFATEPRVFLLDEPVSSLDERSRDQICRELKALQRRASTTTLHVCHNFAEMLVVADRAAVLREGRVVQIGTPREILEQPIDRFVADFVQARNILSARATRAGDVTRLVCPGGASLHTSAPATGTVELVVRPEKIRLCSQSETALPANPEINRLVGTVTSVADLGLVVAANVDCGGGLEVVASPGLREFRALKIRPGDRVALLIHEEDVHILKGESGGT